MRDQFRRKAMTCVFLALSLAVMGGKEALAEKPVPKPEPPKVIQVYPSDGMQHVPVDTSIHIVFSEPMDESATIQAVTISPAPQLVYPTSWQLLHEKSVLVITPARPLRYSTTYRITLKRSARDSQGAEMKQDHEWSFTTIKSPPAPVEVPRNGGFASGDLTGWDWQHTETRGSRAAQWAVVSDRDREHVLKIARPPTFEPGSCAVAQIIDAEMPAAGLVFLSFDMLLGDYSLKQYAPGETYPLKVTVNYLDKDRKEHSFKKAFYYHLPSEGGIDSLAEFVEIDKWTSKSYNLSALVPRPVHIKSIRFDCSGWAWMVALDNIKLVW